MKIQRIQRPSKEDKGKTSKPTEFTSREISGQLCRLESQLLQSASLMIRLQFSFFRNSIRDISRHGLGEKLKELDSREDLDLFYKNKLRYLLEESSSIPHTYKELLEMTDTACDSLISISDPHQLSAKLSELLNIIDHLEKTLQLKREVGMLVERINDNEESQFRIESFTVHSQTYDFGQTTTEDLYRPVLEALDNTRQAVSELAGILSEQAGAPTADSKK
jgi:hypothetical protein